MYKEIQFAFFPIKKIHGFTWIRTLALKGINASVNFDLRAKAPVRPFG